MRANIGKGIAAGIIGGVIASWVMERFQQALSGIQQKVKASEPAFGSGSEGQHEPEPHAGEDREPATVKAAVLISSKVLDHQLQPGEKETAGEAVHYAFGALAGAVYGAAAEFASPVSAGAGLGFGVVLWAVSDELGVPLAGLSGPPRDYPASVHASALAAHLVYGVSTELVRSALRRGLLAR